MSMEFCAYSFLKEEDHRCDYEIASDQLASSLSIARHYVKHITQSDIVQLIELVYHANGSIRGKCAIQQLEVQQLKEIYERYYVEMKHFVLPDGCIGASYLHKIRADVKAVIRIMHQIEREGFSIESTLFDFMNLLSNTCFMMCLYENKYELHMEREFVSRSYES
ncbi:ATP:cob(I)alamin adenosyltransferase [Amedibacillus sp. YH-ame10]